MQLRTFLPTHITRNNALQNVSKRTHSTKRWQVVDYESKWQYPKYSQYFYLGVIDFVETTSKSDNAFPDQILGSTNTLKLLAKLHHTLTLSVEQAVILVLSIVGIITRFVGLGNRVMSHDESLHVYYSWLLSTGKGFVHTPMMHGPFLFESTALMNFLFGANDFTSRLVPALLGTLIAIVIPQLLKPWIGKIGALIGTVLFLISPYMLYYSRYIRHDTLVIAWMLLVVFAIFGYLHDRQYRYLVLFAIGLALMFSTMEITFIYLAIFASYLAIRILFSNGLRWNSIKITAEFDLLVLMITLGAFFSSSIALPVLNPIFTRLTGAPYVDLAVLGSQETEWAAGQTGFRLWLLFGIFGAIGTTLGFIWGRLRWLKLAGLFLVINIVLFTTFFTNPSGIESGFIGSLGYWLSQQSVARGGQPWYYFLFVFPIYEYLPLIGGISAAVYYLVRRKQLSETANIFIPFTVWWAVGIFIALSAAGEKMPWLSTHITVPFLILTAWWVGHILEMDLKPNSVHLKRKIWFKRIVVFCFSILALITMRTSFFVNFVNYDYATEFIDYAHGAPGVKWVLSDIQSIANHTGAGKDLKIAYDDEVSWPMSWYLKDYPNQGFYGSQPNREALNAPVVISGPKNWNKVELLLGSNYHRFEVIRLWWPIEDYKDLTWERIRGAITNSGMREAIWDILWKRDYTSYASLTNAEIKPPTVWPLNEKMRIYVRKDIALQMLSLSMGTTMLADLPQQVDAYAAIQKTIDPELTITTGGLNAPRNLTVGKDGSIYVADTGNSRIVKYSSKGEYLTAWGDRTPDDQIPPRPGTFVEPWGITTDGDGNILVADTWNHRIQKFSPDGKFLLQWGSSGLAVDGLDRLWGPRGLAVASDGKVYVTDTGNKRVVVFSTDGKALFEFDTSGDAELDEPVGIALGPDGNVYVADTWNLRVVKFSPNGEYVSSFPIQGWKSDSIDNKPYLVVYQNGRILVTDPEGFRVLVFSPEGKPLSVFGGVGTDEFTLGLPNGVAIDQDNAIWVSDSVNNRLILYPKIQP